MGCVRFRSASGTASGLTAQVQPEGVEVDGDDDQQQNSHRPRPMALPCSPASPSRAAQTIRQACDRCRDPQSQLTTVESGARRVPPRPVANKCGNVG